MHEQRLPQHRVRNRNFDETHRILIEKAVELISEVGSESLSISALARVSGINRSTVYYHFDSREALIEAVKAWSADQMSDAFLTEGDNEKKVADSIRFVLANPEVAKLWIEEFISGGDIRDRYPLWDEFVAAVDKVIVTGRGESSLDPAALSLVMLSGALIGARVYHSSIRPDLPVAEAVAQYARAHNWILARCGFE